MDKPTQTAVAAAVSAVATNEALQRYKPHMRIPGVPPVAGAVGLATAGAGTTYLAWKKMEDGVPKGVVLGVGVGAFLTGLMDAAGI